MVDFSIEGLYDRSLLTIEVREGPRPIDKVVRAILKVGKHDSRTLVAAFDYEKFMAFWSKVRSERPAPPALGPNKNVTV